MDNFLITLATVAMLFAYAIPGFILVKTKLIKEHSISAFAFVLMYVCQPCLTIYSFDQADFTKETVINMAIAFGIVFALMVTFLTIFYFIMRKRFDDIMNRLYIICTCFGNVAFFGNPILHSIFGTDSLYIYSTVFFIAMNIIGWTIGCYLITKDTKFISLKKVFLNPAVLSLIVALPLFFCKVKLVDINYRVEEFVTILAKMTTPLCMLIIGMRLGTMEIKPIFTNYKHYIFCSIKQIVFPLTALLVVYFLPIDVTVKQALFILCATPCAVIIQTFAEMLGQGQKESVNMVILSTMTCIATLPLLSLIPFN
ncbi:MAG: AEC family transporter [Clostridia bacterium]|nr:AEC family transporter [Clostridia bacterium]